MIYLVSLTLLVALSWQAHGAVSSPDAFFKAQITAKVLPHFKAATQVYKTDILQRLADLSPAEMGNATVKKLNCDVQKLSTSLKKSVAGCDQVRKAADTQLENTVAEESRLTREKKQKEAELKSFKKELGTLKNNLKDAINKENAAKQGVTNAEAEVRRQEKRLEDARKNCIGRRRRKRGIGGFLKKVIRAPERIVRKTVLKPLEKVACSVFNRGGINNAKHARNLANNNLNNARNRVKQLRAQVAAANQKVGSKQTQINQVNAKLRVVAKSVADTKKHRNELVTATTKIKAVANTVSTLLGRSQVFKEAVKTMILFDDIILPMKAVNEQLHKVHVGAPSMNVDRAVLNKMVANLKLLEAKLPDMPFVETIAC